MSSQSTKPRCNLILSRRREEAIEIITPHGEQITVYVASVRGVHVRLGVRACPQTQIWREELIDRARPAVA